MTTVRSRLEPLLSQPGAAELVLRATLHSITQALTHVAANLDAGVESPENKFRSGVIELLGRIPVNELPKQKVTEILNACHRVLETDHEDNGVIIQRVLFDIHKSYKGYLEEQTGPFFKWLEGLFEALPATVERQLEAASAPVNEKKGKKDKEEAIPALVPARESLKIAIDVALMVFYLMQAYPKRMAIHGQTLVPLMVKVVSLLGPDKDDVPASASSVYADFRLAQIKTLAFMIVVSRAPQMGPLLAPHREEVCTALIRMMETAPDILTTRKEVLTCMRNMLNTPFKPGLQSKMDSLLDEKTLLGTDRVCIEALRQIAYMNLAELVAVTKSELTLEQVQKVIKLYTRNALDPLNPSSLQTTSLRLLYNIIEVLFARRAKDPESAEAYRNLLSTILECMVAKLGALRRQVPRKVCELRDLEDNRKHRKEAEAATAADNVAAGKKALSEHKKKVVEAAAVIKVKLEAEAAIAAEEAAAAAAKAAAEAAEAAALNPPAEGAEIKQEGGEGAVTGAEAMATDAAPAGEQPAAAAGEQAPATAAGEAPKTEPMDTTDAAAGAAAAAPPSDAEKKGDAAAAGTATTAQEGEKKEEEKQAEEEPEVEEEEEPKTPDGPIPPPFRVLLHATAGSSAKEREILEFRTLLHTVLNCLKNILYITVAYHTPRALQQPLGFPIAPWGTRPNDVRSISHILSFGLPAISFFETASPPGFDAREALAELFTQISDGREFADIFAPRMSYIFDLILANRWYMRFLRHLIEGDAAARTFVNRYSIATVLRFLVAEKLHTLDDMESAEGKLTLELLEICFEMLPRIQNLDIAKAQALAHHGVPTGERAVLPHVIAFIKFSFQRMAAGGPTAQGHMSALRSLFYSLAVINKFQEIQTAVGATGLHLRIVDTALGLIQGPSTRTKEAEEAAAELCLLVPARLEHLIPVLPRMMHAVVLALNGSDRSVHIALRVLDVWVESFNPEFIERSMAAVTKPLMAALWSHIRPPPHPFGAKVAEMLGKMGGRGRRWLSEGTAVDFKAIPEYGLRVILAFPPHTSFLVPLDRCVQLAWTTVESGTADVHRRKNALRLLQICVGTLARLHLPADMMKALPSPAPTVPAASAQEAVTTAAAAAGVEGEAAAAPAPAAPTAEGGQEPAPAAPSTGTAAAADKTKESKDSTDAKPELIDDALGRLQALLFGNGPTPEIPSELNWPTELGVKTKKQHAAEKQMLETVLTALMASAAVDSELEGANAKEFAHATCRHFALLLAAGWASTPVRKSTPAHSIFYFFFHNKIHLLLTNLIITLPLPELPQSPPPAPPSSRVDKYNVRGGVPAFVATLKHLQPHVLLDAFQQGLRQSNAKARAAVVECMGVFLDTLQEVGAVQARERQKAAAAAEKGDKAAKGKGADKDDAEAGKASATAPDEPYLNIQQDLVMRAMHCCHGDSWPSRLGGIAALEALSKRVPQRWLVRAASYIIKALMGVLRALPDNATQEQEEITAVLLDIVRRALDLPESAVEAFISEPMETEVPGSDGKDAAPMEIEQEPEEESAAQTGKRGKRTKRGGAAQPPRKRQQRGSGASAGEEGSPAEAAAAAEAATTPTPAAPPAAERGEDDPVTDAARRLQNDLLGAVVSSKSNDAVRSAGTKCLRLLSHFTGLTVGALMKNMLGRNPSQEPSVSGSQKTGASTPQTSGRPGAADPRTPATAQKPAGQQQSRLGSLLERRMLPLRSISTQTNYAHSTAFLLRTCGEQLEFTPSLATFLADCCTIMELDDTVIASGAAVRGQAPKPEVLIKLHVACLEVLVAALAWPAFRASGDVEIKAHGWGQAGEILPITGQQLRDRTAMVFIRKLGSPHDEIVDLATQGLKYTSANDILEKQVLHEALRPILMDLAVYHRMTVPLLRHVHRLMDLLSGQFNVTLGQKLTEHLQKWMEADKYLHGQAQPVAWEPGTEWEIAASMLNIFHKLPPAAKEFLETHEGRPGIVVLTIGLEEALYQLSGTVFPSKMWSPYRAPLTRFLNRYAEESVAYFLDSKSRLSKPEYFYRLLDIIRNPLGRPLLEALKSSVQKFVAVLQDDADDEGMF
jgi:hypothetical protein